jgi:NAD(P)-dependent dehydrogenase (short-subunit alcohol dehydrogenase family)
LENLVLSYADETEHAGKLRVHIVDPGATRTRMRQLAFPGEEPSSVKPPEDVARAILDRVLSDAKTGERVRLDA